MCPSEMGVGGGNIVCAEKHLTASKQGKIKPSVFPEQNQKELSFLKD